MGQTLDAKKEKGRTLLKHLPYAKNLPNRRDIMENADWKGESRDILHTFYFPSIEYIL